MASIDTIYRKETLFRSLLRTAGTGILIILAAVFATLLSESLPALKKFGYTFVSSTEWNPVNEVFGVKAFLAGTVITSFAALCFSIPFSISIALFLGEYRCSGVLSSILRTSVELMAGIPSVVYGFWGLFTIVPLMQSFEMSFGIIPYGVGIATASVILTIMIIPYSASLGSEIIQLVPDYLKEAAYALGATRTEVILKVILPYCRSGLIAGFLLSLGRALGETMAVTMVIGNANCFPDSFFSLGNTLASVIANEFAEATGILYPSSLFAAALVLMLLTTIINIAGKLIISKTTQGGTP